MLVGGISQLYQGDLDLGRLAVERLEGDGLGPGVVVEDLHYGAVAVTQLLEDLRPGTLVLLGAVQRGRAPGTVERRWTRPPRLSPQQAQRAIGEAVTGYVTVDLVVEVAAALGALPARTIVVEVEPATTEPSEQLSPEAVAGLDEAVALARAEVRRAPLLELAEHLRGRLAEADLEWCPAVGALDDLLAQLRILEREGRWGRTFSERDRLRSCICAGQTPEGMSTVDWVLWWHLIEELDRLQPVEARGGA